MFPLFHAEDQTLEGKEAKDLVGSQVRSKARTLGGFGLGCSTISTISWEFFASSLGSKAPVLALKGSRYQKEEHLKRLEQCGPKCSAVHHSEFTEVSKFVA